MARGHRFARDYQYQDLNFFNKLIEKPYYLNSENIKLAIDSGAHTLWVKEFKKNGGKLSNVLRQGHTDWSFLETDEFKNFLEDYIAWLHENKHLVEFYITMDVMFNPEKSREITKYMESCGLNPIPVYHFGESIDWFKKMLDEGYEYICISGMSKLRKKQYIPFGDQVFDLIKDSTGRPSVKIHGLGMATPEFIERYPWHSCDASTWMNMSKNGTLLIPKPIYDNQKIVGKNYLAPPYTLATTTRRINDPMAFERQSETFAKYISDYIEENGFTFENVREAYHVRDVINTRWFYKMEAVAKLYYKDVFNYPEGANLYMAGMPSGASAIKYKLIRLLHDINMPHTRWLPTFAYKKHLGNLLDVKNAAINSIDLRELQTNCDTMINQNKIQSELAAMPKPIVRKKLHSKTRPPLVFKAHIEYELEYTVPYNHYGNKEEESILNQELIELQKGLKDTLECQLPSKINLEIKNKTDPV